MAHWLFEAVGAAQSARDSAAEVARLAALLDRDEESLDLALGNELRGTMRAITASAFAVDAFYASVKSRSPAHPNQDAWRANRTPRYAQVFETLRYHLKLKAPGASEIRDRVKELFRFRDWAVHPGSRFREPAFRPCPGGYRCLRTRSKKQARRSLPKDARRRGERPNDINHHRDIPPLNHVAGRQIQQMTNLDLHIAALTQVRMRGSTGRAYYDTKIAAGKNHNEAMRCLKRRLADYVWRQMIRDEHTPATGSGGHVGAAIISSAAGSIPGASSSEKSLPSPPRPAYDPTNSRLTNTEEPRSVTALTDRRSTAERARVEQQAAKPDSAESGS